MRVLITNWINLTGVLIAVFAYATAANVFGSFGPENFVKYGEPVFIAASVGLLAAQMIRKKYLRGYLDCGSQKR